MPDVPDPLVHGPCREIVRGVGDQQAGWFPALAGARPAHVRDGPASDRTRAFPWVFSEPAECVGFGLFVALEYPRPERIAMYLSGESLLVILLVGIVSGWLAGKIVDGGGFGLIWDLVLGVAGAFIGDWLLPRLGINLGSGIVALIINATIGASLLLLIIRLVSHSRGRWGGRWGSRWGGRW